MNNRSPSYLDEKEKPTIAHSEYLSETGDAKAGHAAQGPAIEGNVQLINDNGEIRKIPVPSSSPRDPLNFSKWRKYGILTCCIWFSCMALTVLTSAGSLAPIFFGIYAPRGVDPAIITRLFTWPSLFTGVANFGFLPLCLVIGRRPCFILSATMLCAGCIWAALSGTSFDSHLGARILMGFAAGATESTLPLILSDYTFVHERAKVFGLYSFIVSIPQSALTVGASYQAVLLSWQWFYWIFLILSATGLILVIFFCPETMFPRPAFSIDGAMSRADEFGNIIPLTEEEMKAEMDLVAEAHDADKDFSQWRIALGFRSKIKSHEWKAIPHAYMTMARALIDPAIVWALGLSSIALSIIILQSLTWGNILIGAYGWSSQSIGLNALGSIPAGIMAFIACGWGGDKLNILLAKRNGGMHVPEHRLAALVFPVLAGIAVLLMYGWCGEHPERYHWFAIIFSGNALNFACVSCFIVTTTYAVEVMAHNAGAGIVMVVGGKNLVSFGVASGMADIASAGRVWYLCGILTGVWAGWALLGVALYFLMPKYRRKAAQKSL